MVAESLLRLQGSKQAASLEIQVVEEKEAKVDLVADWGRTMLRRYLGGLNAGVLILWQNRRLLG
jgi:hypothetical protein